jgi:hypothetical protein
LPDVIREWMPLAASILTPRLLLPPLNCGAEPIVGHRRNCFRYQLQAGRKCVKQGGTAGKTPVPFGTGVYIFLEED